MRRQNIDVPGGGAYVFVYQRDGQKPLADVVFFDGDRDVAEMRSRRDAMTAAIELMERWGR